MNRPASHSRLTTHLIRLIGDKIARRSKDDGRVCILNYHRILPHADPFLDTEPDVEAFHWQMELLATCFNVMPLPTVLDCLGRERLPPRTICISFDDGYRSVHDLALPILKKFSLPATVFVTSGYMDGENMWNDRIIEAVQRLPSAELDLRDLGLGVHPMRRQAERKLAVHRLTEMSKYLPPKARAELPPRLENLAGNAPGPGLMLTREMVSSLAQQGIEIGAHTVSHPILTSLENEDARHEITACKQQLEAITGQPVRLFAYPNGKPGMDFDDRHVQMAKEAGFTAAFTTTRGAATGTHDRFQLPRSRPWDASPLRFGLRLLRWLAA